MRKLFVVCRLYSRLKPYLSVDMLSSTVLLSFPFRSMS